MSSWVQKIPVYFVSICLFIAPFPAKSENLKVVLEAPVGYSFFSSDDGEALQSDSAPSGILASIEFFIFEGMGENISLGIGIDSYNIPLSDKQNKLVFSFKNLHVQSPLIFDLLTARIGLGLGTVRMNGINESDFKQTATSQFFGKIGFVLSDDAEVLASFHNVFAQIEAKDSESLLEAGGILTGLGLGIKF